MLFGRNIAVAEVRATASGLNCGVIENHIKNRIAMPATLF
jgi:hypothetical protein